jgi:hypothetical protein
MYGLLGQNANQVFSQIVTIPDTAFLAALIDRGVDTNEDGQISFEEAEALTSLTVDEENITDLTGINAFVNLTYLYCSDNKLSSLDVSNNTVLTSLSCSNNQLTSLNVSACSELTSLSCSHNQLISLDVSKNINLSVGHHGYSTLPGLNCSNNQLSSLDVSGCTSLRYLVCSNNQLSSLDVSNCASLTTLHCSNNQLSNLDISNNTQLQRISTDKYYGYASGLICSNNQLSSLDISNNLKLSRIYCSGNQITELDVSNNPDLDEIHCDDNRLVNLDVSNNTALKRLQCGNNQLSSLDISKNLDLLSLDCSNNLLSSLDLSNNKYLGDGGNWIFGSKVIYLSDMPSLNQVCVWDTFNEDSLNLNTEGSPNINFTKGCATGIVEEQFISLSVYPNPTNNILNIETENNDCYSLEIHSLNGQLIYKEEMEGNSKQIDLSTISKGIYFITVRSNEGVSTKKVVKL